MFVICISLNTDEFEIFHIILLGICNSVNVLCPLLNFLLEFFSYLYKLFVHYS